LVFPREGRNKIKTQAKMIEKREKGIKRYRKTPGREEKLLGGGWFLEQPGGGGGETSRLLQKRFQEKRKRGWDFSGARA